MAGTDHPRLAPFVERGHRLRGARGVFNRTLVLGLVLAISLGLGACAVQWGENGDDSQDSSGQTPRDRNRLYQQEQERMDRQRQLDRSGPSDR